MPYEFNYTMGARAPGAKNKEEAYSMVRDAYKRAVETDVGAEEGAMDAWAEMQMKRKPGTSRDYWRGQYMKMQREPITGKTQKERERYYR